MSLHVDVMLGEDSEEDGSGPLAAWILLSSRYPLAAWPWQGTGQLGVCVVVSAAAQGASSLDRST